MPDLVRRVRRLRRDPDCAKSAFRHRLRIGGAVAVLILLLSFLW